MIAVLKKLLFRSQLRRNIFSGSLATMLGLSITLISYPVYLYFLGYETYGLWLVSSTILTVTQLGNFGVSLALIKLIAEHHARNDVASVESYTSTGTTFLAAIGLAIALGVTLLREPLSAGLDLQGQHAIAAMWLFPAMALLSAYTLVNEALHGVLSGLGRMDLANYARVGGRLGALLTSIALLLLDQGLESLVIGNALAAVATHVAYLVWIRRVARVRTFALSRFSASQLKTMIVLGTPVVVGPALSMLLGPFNNLMASRYVGLAAVPVLELAYRGAMELRGLVASGLAALVPEISGLSAKNEWQRIKDLDKKSWRLLGRVGAPLFVAVGIGATVLLKVWLGSRYTEPLADVFRIMLVASFLSLLAVPAYYALLAVGRSGTCLIGHLIQSALNVVVVSATVALTGGLSLQLLASSVAVGFGCSTVYFVWRHRVTVDGELEKELLRTESELVTAQSCPREVGDDRVSTSDDARGDEPG